MKDGIGTGRGVLVTPRGVTIGGILPVEQGEARLTAERIAVLERMESQKLTLAPSRFERDELHER